MLSATAKDTKPHTPPVASSSSKKPSKKQIIKARFDDCLEDEAPDYNSDEVDLTGVYHNDWETCNETASLLLRKIFTHYDENLESKSGGYCNFKHHLIAYLYNCNLSKLSGVYNPTAKTNVELLLSLIERNDSMNLFK